RHAGEQTRSSRREDRKPHERGTTAQSRRCSDLRRHGAPPSSGGFTWRNATSKATSYTIFSTPHTISGRPRKGVESSAPDRAGLTDDARLRGTAVMLAAAVRSAGVTTAITKEVRVGTSIFERAARRSRSASTTDRLDEKAATRRQMLEGMCVN